MPIVLEMENYIVKITGLESFVVNQQLGDKVEFSYSQAWYSERTILLLKITTDGGITGWGA